MQQDAQELLNYLLNEVHVVSQRMLRRVCVAIWRVLTASWGMVVTGFNPCVALVQVAEVVQKQQKKATGRVDPSVTGRRHRACMLPVCDTVLFSVSCVLSLRPTHRVIHSAHAADPNLCACLSSEDVGA